MRPVEYQAGPRVDWPPRRVAPGFRNRGRSRKMVSAWCPGLESQPALGWDYRPARRSHQQRATPPDSARARPLVREWQSDWPAPVSFPPGRRPSASSRPRSESGRRPYFYRPIRMSSGPSPFASAPLPASRRGPWRAFVRKCCRAAPPGTPPARANRKTRRAILPRSTSRKSTAADSFGVVLARSQLVNGMKRFEQARIAIREK